MKWYKKVPWLTVIRYGLEVACFFGLLKVMQQQIVIFMSRSTPESIKAFQQFLDTIGSGGEFYASALIVGVLIIFFPFSYMCLWVYRALRYCYKLFWSKKVGEVA